MSCCCSSLESWKLLRHPSLFKLIKAVLVDQLIQVTTRASYREFFSVVSGNHWQIYIYIYVTHPSLVDGLVAIFYFPIYWECHHPNWRTHIFQRGGPTTNQPSTFLYNSLVTHCEKILPHHWKAASTVFLSLFFALRSSGKGSLDVIRSLPGRPAGSESAEIDRLMYQLGSCEITEHFPGWIGFCSPVRLNEMIQGGAP